MPFQQTLLAIDELHSFSNLSAFTQNIPLEWIESALNLSAKASIRRRRLPEDQVLWLVLGMALFRDESISEVVRRLNICAQGLASVQGLAKSGVSEARKRLGAEPVKWLFQRTGEHWAMERHQDDSWNGLQVFAMDGVQFRTPDTPELREHFGSGNTSTDRQTPYPIMRMVALMNVRSHIVMDAQLGAYRTSEIRLAESMMCKLPDHSITLLDKGFWSADLLLNLSQAGQNRHWLIPERKGLVYEELKRYSDTDRLLKMKVSPQARKRNPELPEHWHVRAVTYCINGVDKTVFTSLDQAQYSEEDIADLYHERWEIELGFRDIKSSMQNNALTLRSKKIDLIYQEAWALVLSYNVIRREASLAAASVQQSPSRISFKHAYQYIAAQLVVMAGAQPLSKTGVRLSEMRDSVSALFLDTRPRPSRPRAVKMSKSRYPVNRRAAPLK